MESVVASNAPAFDGCEHETNVINTLLERGIRSGVHHSMTVLDSTQWYTVRQFHNVFGPDSIPLRQRHALRDTLISVHKATGIAHNQITPFVLYLHVDNIHTSIGGWDHALVQSTEKERRIDYDKIACYCRTDDMDSCFRNALDTYRTMSASRTRPLCSLDIAQDLSPADQVILEDYKCPLTKRVAIQPTRLWYKNHRRQNRRQRKQQSWTIASRHVYELSAIRADNSTYYDGVTQSFHVCDPVTGYEAIIGDRPDRNVTSQVAYMLQHHSVYAEDDDDDGDDNRSVTGGNTENNNDNQGQESRKRGRSFPLVPPAKTAKRAKTTTALVPATLRGFIEDLGYRFEEMEAALLDARKRAIGDLDSIVKDLLDWIVPVDMSTEQQTILRAAIFQEYLANYPWGSKVHWYPDQTNVDMFPYFEGILDVSDPSILGVERIQNVGFPSTIRPCTIVFRTTTEANPFMYALFDEETLTEKKMDEDSFLYSDKPINTFVMFPEETRNEQDITHFELWGTDRYIGKQETPPFPDTTRDRRIQNLPRWSWVAQLTIGCFSAVWPIEKYLLPQLIPSKQTLFMSDMYDSMFLAFSKNLSTPEGHQLLYKGRLHTSLCTTCGMSIENDTDPYSLMLDEKYNADIRPIRDGMRMHGNNAECFFSSRVNNLIHSGAFYFPRPRINTIRKNVNDDSYRSGTSFDLPAGPLRPLRGIHHEETPIFPIREPCVKRIIFEGRKGSLPGLLVLHNDYEMLLSNETYKHYPYFRDELKALIDSGENTSRFILIYLQLLFPAYDDQGVECGIDPNAHANYIIIDQEHRVFFRYDPWGTCSQRGRDFPKEERELEASLKTILFQYQNVSYRMDTLEDHSGIQLVEGEGWYHCSYDIGGYCLMWTFFLLDFLANNADVITDVRKIHQYVWNYFEDFAEAYEITQPEAALTYVRRIKRIVEAGGKDEPCKNMLAHNRKCLCNEECLKIMGLITLCHY
jgi:hypothetical protein